MHESNPSERPAGDRRVVIVTFDQYTDIDLVILWDLLNRVGEPGWSVRLVGEDDRHRSMTGLDTRIHGPISEANQADAVLFGSGRGTRVKMKDEAFLSRFQLDPGRQLIGSICSGALLLAALGLLDGKRATTYPTAVPLLEGFGVRVVQEPFVCEGNVATAGGCLAAQYLAGWVIERLCGKGLRDRVIASCQPVGEGLAFDTDLTGLNV